MAHYEPSNPSF